MIKKRVGLVVQNERQKVEIAIEQDDWHIRRYGADGHGGLI